MAVEEPSPLPPGAAREVLHRYADLLRVGRLTVNGVETKWDTNTSSELQLRGFCVALDARLRELLPDTAEGRPAALRVAPYWILKAVSINYALIEVVLMVRRRVGVLCTIETRQEGGGALVTYGVEVRPGPSLRVSLTWRKGNNIVYRDPRTAQTKVKGTLGSLSTEFRLPPEPGEVPAYHLDMRLRRSLAAKVASRLACAGGDVRRQHSLHLDEPLSSDGLLEAAAGEPSCCERAVCLPREKSDATPSTLPPNEDCAEDLDTLSSGLSADEAPVGHLRVRALRARLDEVLRPGASWAKPWLYATCTVAGRTERSSLIPSCPLPEWPEAWDFPVRAKDLRGEVRVEFFGADTERGELELLGSAAFLVSVALSRTGAVAVSEPLRGRTPGSLEMELEMLPDVAAGTDSAERSFEAVDAEPGARCPSPEDLPLQIHVRAAAPHPTTCSLWCSRPCTTECS
mmetsp:Transcript_117828/g.367151  ORF Transcript_117828/g.367151 Transcript_117828/m.367151 type:complete len:458 (+) Transcript_117828:116-1489(+)